ncbi:glycosyltransferase family 39 protein [Prevotella sp. 10(H)]|uniref:glycosyltransferase family 39 protein n=1 Tax=Prevotella sp. 10(H) TaxID=1158294 RepID=UPI0009E0809B|nr:glycosyltransferase family 39 protein [Prevotella sp. 10(H)]
MKKALHIFLILVTIFFITLISVFLLIRTGLLSSYEDSPALKEFFLIENSLSSTGFFVLISIFLLFAILSVFLIIKINLFYVHLSSFFSYIGKACRTIWKDVKDPCALLILLPPLISSVYFAIVLPISYDEALTYVDFTNNPILYCISSYPYPNNHVFHSVITHITKHLPFFDILFKLRISSIIVSLSTWIIAYSFVKRFYSAKVALFSVAIASMLFMSVYYSYMSRGYALVTLFFVISLYASYNIIKYGSRNKDWVIFSISNILGFYTMPSFLYPFLTLNLLILIYNYKNIKQQILFNLFITFATLLCYMPIILHQGFGVLSITPGDRLGVLSLFPLFFRNTFNEIFGLYLPLTLLIIVVSFVIALVKRNKDILVLWMLFGAAPVILLAIHSVIPFPRTFIYYGFIVMFLIGITLSAYIEKVPKLVLTIVLLVLQVGLFFNFKNSIVEYESFNIDFHDVSEKYIEEGKTFYILSGLNIESHKFEMMLRGYNYSKSKYDRIFIDFEDFRLVDTDTLKGNYDYIVIDKPWDRTVERKPVYSNKTLNVYTFN